MNMENIALEGRLSLPQSIQREYSKSIMGEYTTKKLLAEKEREIYETPEWKETEFKLHELERKTEFKELIELKKIEWFPEIGQYIKPSLHGRSKPERGLNYIFVIKYEDYKYKLSKIEKILRETGKLTDDHLKEIDEIRDFAWKYIDEMDELKKLLVKANEILLGYYRREIDKIEEEIRKNINRENLMKFNQLMYIVTHLEEYKNLEELRSKALQDASKWIEYCNKLARKLGASPII